MNNKYLSKTNEVNNENLCPITRKRPLNKSNGKISPGWKLLKSERITPYSSPIFSDFEGMGVSILPEDDDSSMAINATAASVPVVSNTSNCSVVDDKSFFFKKSKELSLASSPGLFDVNSKDSPLAAEQNKDKDTLITTDDSLSSSCDAQSLDNKEFDFNCNNYIDHYSKATKGDITKKQHQKWTINKNIACNSNVQKGSSMAMMTMTMDNNAGCKSLGLIETKVSRSPLATLTCNSFTTNSTTLQPETLQMSQIQYQNIGEQQYSHSPSILIKSNEHNLLHHQHSSSYKQISLVKDHPLSSSTQIPLDTTPSSQEEQTVEEKQSLLPPPPPPLSTQRNRPITPLENEIASDFFLYRQNRIRPPRDTKNYFNLLSDEIILQIFKWLPKKALLRCGYVCRRFNRCASDESLWTRLDLGGRTLKSGCMENILNRGVVILRLAQSEICGDIFEAKASSSTSSSLITNDQRNNENFISKLQYLDLSMISINKSSLKTLLSCCRNLKKLSLEHLSLNDEICAEVAKNEHLGTLNLTMCNGLEAWSIRKMMESLSELTSLNISWTNLSIDAITALVTHITPNLLRLNVAGCRKTMFDSHLSKLVKRCPSLLELDVSDCTGLTGSAINIICQFKMLEYLSMSRCYLIPATAYIELKNMSSLMYLDIFGMLTEAALTMLEHTFTNISINKFLHSSVARPTVGTRRTSIWGLRTRD